MHEKQLCPVCLNSGRRSNLTSFQVNFDEALWLCEYKRCIYPLGQNSEPTFNRTLDDIPSEKDIQTRAPSAQVALQMQVANRLTECHQKIQKDVIGIQTGSPLFMKTKVRQNRLKHGNIGFNSLQNGVKPSSDPNNGFQNGVDGANSHLHSFKMSNGTSISTDFWNKNLPKTDNLNGNLRTSDLPYSSIGKSNAFEGLQLGKNKVNGQNNQNRSLKGPVSFNKSSVKNSNGPVQNCRTLDPNLLNSNLEKSLCDSYSTIDKAKASEFRLNGSVTQNTKQFLQWKNKDALCWLDVLLCLLVHNKTLKQTVVSETQKNSLVYKLIQAHKQATLLLTNQTRVGGATEKSVVENSSEVNIQEGQINVKKMCFKNDILASDKTLLQNDTPHPGEILDTIRDEILVFLQKKVHFERGKPSSPVLALPELLKSEPIVDKVFRSKYKFVYDCPKCKFLEDTNCENVLPSLPEVVKDFNILTPVHKKKCLNCSYTKGKRQMLYKMLPQSFMMHFINGLPPGDWCDLEFTFNTVSYTVTGVVQYLRNPDHFVAWLRNPEDNTWIECDGLQLPITAARVQPPLFSWKQIHIVMWEQAQSVCSKGDTALGKTLTAVKVCTVNRHLADKPPVRNGCLTNIKSIGNGASSINGFNKDLVTEPVISSTNSFIKDQNKSILTSTTQMSACVSLASAFDQNNGSDQSGLLNVKAGVNEQNGLIDNSFPKQQISIDTHKFLNSSTENSSLGRTGSSLSSTCSELSDNVSLPEFISNAQLGNDLVKPVPCRNESPVENSEFSSRNTYEADPYFTHNKSDKNITIDTTQSSLNFPGKKAVKFSLLNDQGKIVVPDIKPSSVFKSPVKSTINRIQPVALGNQTNNIMSKSHESSCDSKILPGLGRMNSSCAQNGDDEKPVPSTVDIKVEHSADDTSQRKNTNFKFPSLLRMKSKPSRISRDAFQTLPKAIPKSDLSPTSSPRMSPAKTLTPSPYLSAVKHYLINKTTDSAQFKTRFEGLSLKSAPFLNKTVDLSDLKRNDSLSSTSASPSSETSSQKSKSETISQTSKTDTSSQNSKTKKDRETLLKRRKKTPSKDTLVKKQKTGLKSSLSTSDLVAHKPIYPHEGSSMTKGHSIIHMTPDKKNNQIQKVSKSTIDSPSYAQPYNKENGNLIVTPEKSKNMDSETDSVLQDLYDALNIPFTSIKETMSDIMVDVNDILGVVETTDLNPATPHKTENFHTVGNQGQLDCGQSMTSRLKPQSGLNTQNNDWSSWTSINKLLIIS